MPQDFNERMDFYKDLRKHMREIGKCWEQLRPSPDQPIAFRSMVEVAKQYMAERVEDPRMQRALLEYVKDQQPPLRDKSPEEIAEQMEVSRGIVETLRRIRKLALAGHRR